MRSGRASRTAVFVCQGRATADGRIAVGRFSDPIAERLLTEDERAPVLLAREGRTPSDGRARFAIASVSACAEIVAPRTVLIDDALTDAIDGSPDCQVVLLGAGLDARPWRLGALSDVRVLSVDHPASQADTIRRVAALPPPGCDLRFVPVDLAAEPLAPALRTAGHDPTLPTIWVWEGVIPYLAQKDVIGTIAALSAISAPRSRLIAQYQTPSLATSVGRRVSGLMARLSRVDSPLVDEPWKSTWEAVAIGRTLVDHGWTVASDESLLDAARRLGSPSQRARSLSSGRVAVADR
jgi:methyltransferase (TIGR00027 family)